MLDSVWFVGHWQSSAGGKRLWVRDLVYIYTQHQEAIDEYERYRDGQCGDWSCVEVSDTGVMVYVGDSATDGDDDGIYLSDPARDYHSGDVQWMHEHTMTILDHMNKSGREAHYVN